MTPVSRVGGCLYICAALVACNSDLPVAASAELSTGETLTITRVATHPFLARYNLRLRLSVRESCAAEADLFPDTGYVSRRNLYRSSDGFIYVVGQFDARVVDPRGCTITLAEFRSLDPHAEFLGSFDVNEGKEWIFLPSNQRSERPFEKR